MSNSSSTSYVHTDVETFSTPAIGLAVPQGGALSNSVTEVRSPKDSSFAVEKSLFSFVELPDDRDDDSEALRTRSVVPSTAASVRISKDSDHCTFFCGTFSGVTVVFIHDFRVLGRGANARVYRGRMIGVPTDKNLMEAVEKGETIFDFPVAIKIMSYKGITTNLVSRLMCALETRFLLHHPGIAVVYYCAVYDEPLGQYALIMEYASGGSVDAILKANERLKEYDVRCILLDIVPALQYMHDEVRVVHNDVKPHNVLAFPEAKTPGDDGNGDYTLRTVEGCTARGRRVHYKLCDFESTGIAKPLSDLTDHLRRPAETILQSSASRLRLGTPSYMSPESCLGFQNYCSNDIWSLGIMTFQLGTGRLPWSSLESSVPSMIVNGFREKFSVGDLSFSPTSDAPCGSLKANSCGVSASFGPVLDELEGSSGSEYSPAFKDFIRCCLVENPFERPTCAQLLQHPFLNANNVEGMAKSSSTSTM